MKYQAPTSYAVKVTNICHTQNGFDTPYTEILAMYTNYHDAKEFANEHKEAFIVEFGQSKQK